MSGIRRALTDAGYRLERHSGASKHERIIQPDGTPLFDPYRGVPVTIPSTAGDVRTRTKMVAQLRRLGVLEHDPHAGGKPTQKRSRREGRASKLASAPPPAAAELQRRELHAKLLPEMERFVAVIAGGWAKAPQIATGAVSWMATQDLPGRPLTVEYAQEQLAKLRAGAMLPLVEERAWQALLDEINGDSEPVLRWIEIHREARGV